jgi:hypothetical protein
MAFGVQASRRVASAGLVDARRQGQQVIYLLTTSVLADIVTELADMGRLNDSRRRVKVPAHAGRPRFGPVRP